MKPSLFWYEPRWAHTRQLWSQIHQILNPVSLIRISFVTAILSAAIIVAFKWAMPQLVLPNLWPILVAFPAIIIGLVAQLGFLLLLPPIVIVRPDKILVANGESAVTIAADTVLETHLTFHAAGRIRLRICYTKGSRTESRVIGVPTTLDFDRLSKLLPIAPIVRDARSRSVTPQSPHETN